jgi:hypothetical protein
MAKAKSRNVKSGVCPHCGGKLSGETDVKGRPRYALRQRRWLWHLVFDGEEAQFKHEKGVEYVARLLAERGPFRALDLAAKQVRNPPSFQTSARQVPPSPGFGATSAEREMRSLREVLDVGGTVQERSASLDEREARQALMEQRRRLEAVARDETAPERKRAAAQRDIEAIVKHLRSEPRRPTDEAQRAVRAVRMAIKRFHRNLLAAVDERGRPDRVLAAFGEHLERHLLIPSGRYSGARAREARGELAGCFVYEEPQNVVWSFT